MTDEGVGDFLGRLTAKLTAAQVPYMVVGSFASSFHGVPRSSRDLDLVIDPQQDSLRRFLDDLPAAEYYADRDTALDALDRRSQFNVIDMATAWKADLIIRRARPFSIEEMRRRMDGEVLGARVFVASPEDTLISKLEWVKAGAGELQLRDAAGIVEVHGDSLDRGYVEHWVAELGLSDLWSRLAGR
jgi:hypothetical protein